MTHLVTELSYDEAIALLDAPAHVHPFPGNILQNAGAIGDDYGASEGRYDTEDLGTANVVTSRMVQIPTQDYGDQIHRPVLDLDMPATLIPSSTEGHFHLYIDKEIPWRKYEDLLYAMAECGILEQGFVNASVERGFTAARLPWIKKVVAP
jgi:hypothetical protein